MLLRGAEMVHYKSKVLAVLNQKGGVGKTTVASVIAEYAAIVAHKNVLVVDLDMQCNSSDYWVGMETAPQATGGQLPPLHPDYDGDPDLDSRSNIADIFFGKAVLPHPTYIRPENGFEHIVEVMVGHPALLERINSEYDNASGKIASLIIDRLGEFLHMEDVANTYDLRKKACKVSMPCCRLSNQKTFRAMNSSNSTLSGFVPIRCAPIPISIAAHWKCCITSWAISCSQPMSTCRNLQRFPSGT
jgi:glutaredoxin-related protein